MTSLSVAFFRDVFLALFTRHMLLMAMLSLVVGVLWFDLGGRLGVPLLFWHPRRTTQAVAGAALAGLLQTIILTSYLRDRPSLAPSYASASTYFLGCTWGLLLVLVASFAVAKLVRRPTQPEAPLLVGLVLTTALVLLAGDLLARLPVPDGLDGSLGAWPFFANLPEGDRHLHLVALVVFVVALFVFGLCVVDRRLGVTTPAVALCTAFALTALAHGFIAARLETASAVVVVALAGLLLGGRPRFKLQVPGLEAHTAHPFSLDAPLRSRLAPNLVSWRGARGPRPLVFLSVRGEASPGALWTAHVLEALERALPELRAHTRVISGSAGAAVGATAYTLGTGSSVLGLDGLSALAHRVVTADLPRAFLPVEGAAHRGSVFAEAWRARLGVLCPPSVAGWREAHPARPSLLLTAETLEDGGRLLLTDLALEGAHAELQAALGQLSLPTALMLVNGGAFVVPATVLPTTPRRRVVAPRHDAGGLESLAMWVSTWLSDETARTWLRGEVAGVLLVELAVTSPPRTGIAARAFEELTGPVTTAPGQGDAAWSTAAEALTRELGADFVHRLSLTCVSSAPTWCPTPLEVRELVTAANEAAASQPVRAATAWWQRRLVISERPETVNQPRLRA